MAGDPFLDDDDLVSFAKELVAVGKCEIVALPLGERGTVLTARDQILSVASLAVDIQSAVGAGDSFAGALTLVLTRKQDLGKPEVLIVQPPSLSSLFR